MFSLYGDLSALNRMSRLGRETRRGGPNSASRSARSASIGALTSSSYRRRWASNQALLLLARRPRKKPLKSPFQPANLPPATRADYPLPPTRHINKEESGRPAPARRACRDVKHAPVGRSKPPPRCLSRDARADRGRRRRLRRPCRRWDGRDADPALADHQPGGRAAARGALRRAGDPRPEGLAWLGPERSRLGLDPDRVADPDPPAAQHIGPDAGAVHQRLQDRLADQLLKVLARFAQLHAAGEDVADPELFADQLVEADSAGGDVAPRFARREHDAVVARQVFDALRLDQGQVAARLVLAVLAVVPVPREADPRQRFHGRDGSDRSAGGAGDVDALDPAAFAHRRKF